MNRVCSLSSTPYPHKCITNEYCTARVPPSSAQVAGECCALMGKHAVTSSRSLLPYCCMCTCLFVLYMKLSQCHIAKPPTWLTCNHQPVTPVTTQRSKLPSYFCSGARSIQYHGIRLRIPRALILHWNVYVDNYYNYLEPYKKLCEKWK